MSAQPTQPFQPYASYDEPPEQQNTEWHNPTSEPVRVDVHMGPSRVVPAQRNDPRAVFTPDGRVIRIIPGKVRYTFAPGETKIVPSEYDSAFHDVRDGHIVGGGAPQLINKTAQKRAEMLDVLDPHKQARKLAQEAAEQARLAKEQHERTLAAETAKAAAAEQALAEAKAAAERHAVPASADAAAKPKKV